MKEGVPGGTPSFLRLRVGAGMLPERMWSRPSRCWVTVLGHNEDWAVVRFDDGSSATVPIGTLAPEAND